MTPRLADSVSGLSTHGKVTVRAATAGSSFSAIRQKRGTGSPAAARRCRIRDLSRAASTAAGALDRRPSRRAMAAAAKGRPNAVNFALSDMVATIEIERRLAELGTLRGVEIRLQFPRWPRAFQADARWLARSAQGGFVREVLSHFVYLTDRLLGPLTVESVSSDFPEPGAAEVAARGVLRGSGVPVHVSAFSGLAGPEVYEWTAWGTERSLRLEQWAALSTSDGGAWKPVPLRQTGSEHSRLTLFAQAVRGEHPRDLADFDSGLRVAEVIEAFLRQ